VVFVSKQNEKTVFFASKEKIALFRIAFLALLPKSSFAHNFASNFSFQNEKNYFFASKENFFY
jgi:hypothetical protein